MSAAAFAVSPVLSTSDPRRLLIDGRASSENRVAGNRIPSRLMAHMRGAPDQDPGCQSDTWPFSTAIALPRHHHGGMVPPETQTRCGTLMASRASSALCPKTQPTGEVTLRQICHTPPERATPKVAGTGKDFSGSCTCSLRKVPASRVDAAGTWGVAIPHPPAFHSVVRNAARPEAGSGSPGLRLQYAALRPRTRVECECRRDGDRSAASRSPTPTAPGSFRPGSAAAAR